MSYADPRIDPTMSEDVKRLRCAQSLVEDMTAIIAAMAEAENTLSEKIADACGELFDVEPSELDLDDMVDALIDAYKSERIRAGVLEMVPEDAAPTPHIVIIDGHRCGPVFDTEAAARDHVAEVIAENPRSKYAQVCRVIDEAAVRHSLDWTFAFEVRL